MNPVVSIIIPAFNEGGNVRLLLDRLILVLDDSALSYEIIFVDDGSSDHTWAEITLASTRFTAVRGLRLSRNFGHQNALLAGMSSSLGRAVITMDGDLQHPPEVIPELLARWEKGSRVVLTERLDGNTVSPFKRLTSRYFYKVFSALSEVNLSSGSSDFRLLDRDALTPILRFQDSDIFLRGAAQWVGFPRATVHYNVDERYSGESKYSIGAMFRFAGTAIISFSTKPLRVGVWVGLATGILAFFELLYVVVQYLLGNTVPGWASVVGIIALLFGILFILLGVIGGYLASIHRALQSRPQYVIQDKISGGE